MGLRETGGSGGVLGQIVSLPQGAVLKVQFATNIKSLRETKEVARLCERAVALARSQLLDRITVHDVNLAGGRGDIRYIFFTFISIVTSSDIDKKLEIYKNLENKLEIYKKNLEIKLEIYSYFKLENKLEIFEFFVNGR